MPVKHVTIELKGFDTFRGTASGQCIFALANVIRHVIYAVDSPEVQGVSGQTILYHAARMIGATPGLAPEAVELMAYLMKPLETPPSTSKKPHLRPVGDD